MTDEFYVMFRYKDCSQIDNRNGIIIKIEIQATLHVFKNVVAYFTQLKFEFITEKETDLSKVCVGISQ